MKSGLEDRNNQHRPGGQPDPQVFVSMKSGLEDRNNAVNEDGTFVINE